MARALTPGLKVAARATVSKIRELPVPGEVLVSRGDTVEANSIVACAELPGELYILRLPERMGLEVFEVLNGLSVKEGDQVKQGDVICTHAGLFGLLKTVSTAPEDGTIEFIAQRTGHIGLRMASRPIEVDAFISGEVIAVEERKSVTIQSQAAYVQGIFGVGGERRGRLRILDVAPDAEVVEADIPEDVDGCILVGGSKATIEALTKAGTLGANGIVTGAIDDQVLAQYLGYDLGIALTGDEDIPMTLIVTEGFGDLELSARTLEVLRQFEGQAAAINGATQVRAGAVRPEIIVCFPEGASQAEVPSESSLARGLEVGATIRIIRVPYFGKQATVVELPQVAQKVETGALTRVLIAELDSGERVLVPRANVELV
ncbi:hypothetical protein OAO01_06460 [Oligoflexia bacterium]|nr:hypothetical protein [Oligoflexia bacterium]